MTEMKTPVYGRDKVLFVRRLADASEGAAARLALQIEHTLNYENSNSSKQTKDGAINTNAGTVATLELTAVSTRDDTNKMLEEAAINGDKLEFWEVDLKDVDEGGKYGAKYMQGTLDSWSLPAPTEDTTDISTTLNIDYLPQKGRATVTDLELQEIAYAFRDITKVTNV